MAEPLKELLARHGLLIFRDCATRDRDQLIELCRSWGPIFSWPFGEVLELVTHHEPKNYIFTPGSVPLHWDGAFREQVPGVEVFHCLEAPDPGAGGETTFVDTPGVLAKAGSETRERWRKICISYSTEKVVHYGGRTSSPLITRHPFQPELETIRWGEPKDEDTSDLNPIQLEVRGADPDSLTQELRRHLYHPDHLYAHRWADNDLVVADNHRLLHGRYAFRSNSPRHIRRVHLLHLKGA